MNTEPNKVELTSRKVIERKLLTALDEGSQVAILATKQDLEDMIAALYGYELGEWTGNTLSWEAHVKRRRNLADGMAQLLKEAFSTTVHNRVSAQPGTGSQCSLNRNK